MNAYGFGPQHHDQTHITRKAGGTVLLAPGGPGFHAIGVEGLLLHNAGDAVRLAILLSELFLSCTGLPVRHQLGQQRKIAGGADCPASIVDGHKGVGQPIFLAYRSSG